VLVMSAQLGVVEVATREHGNSYEVLSMQ
jgi:hypothetical protein